jgi:DNA-binding MarR family transcriptional regulator
MKKTFGFLTGDIARLLRKAYDRRTGSVGLSLAQSRVLAALDRVEGTNQARLAELLEVRPISMARLLDRMEAAELIERRLDPSDRRVYRLYLSAKARPLLQQIHAVAADIRADALAGLSDDERDTLMRLLERVHANLVAPEGNSRDPKRSQPQ